MDSKLEAKLITAFPNVFMDRFEDKMSTCMCWGIDFEKGWFDILWELCEKLEPLCKAANDKLTKEQKELGYKYCFSQLKEKYGTLRAYMTCETDEMSDLIEEAETKSESTCEFCGQLGKLRTEGWYFTLCDTCNTKREQGTLI